MSFGDSPISIFNSFQSVSVFFSDRWAEAGSSTVDSSRIYSALVVGRSPPPLPKCGEEPKELGQWHEMMVCCLSAPVRVLLPSYVLLDLPLSGVFQPILFPFARDSLSSLLDHRLSNGLTSSARIQTHQHIRSLVRKEDETVSSPSAPFNTTGLCVYMCTSLVQPPGANFPAARIAAA
jgi:hypothetical protein